jgi:asparagine synthetase B (glutamine-hydrolysing)
MEPLVSTRARSKQLNSEPEHPPSPLLEPRAHKGISGCFRLASHNRTQSLSSTSEAEGSSTWQGEDYTVVARPEATYAASPNGWEIFALGQSQAAALVAKVLDRLPISEGQDSVPALPVEDARQLCWGLLPASAVIARHSPTGTVCLLRDGMGFLPFYYGLSEDLLRCSSSLASLRPHFPIQGINTDKMVEMLVFGHRSGSRTLFQNLQVVDPGQLVIFRPGLRPQRQRFWEPIHLFDPAERRRVEGLTEQQLLEEIRSALEESFAPLQSRAHVGVPGGGGVDSSVLAAFLAARGQKVTFWCINQPEAPVQEAQWMESLSRQLGIPVTYAQINRAVFLESLVEMIDRAHQPAVGPNFVGGYVVRRLGHEKGEQDFVLGQSCDTLLGGLPTVGYLAPSFRLLRRLCHLLPARLRFWLTRGMADDATWRLDMLQTISGRQLAIVGAGDLERAEMLARSEQIHYPGQTTAQRRADQLTFLQLLSLPSMAHHAFFEPDEWIGTAAHYPFTHPRLVRLGLHLPHQRKRHRGSNKWLWRRFASRYLGENVAFRKKYSFPTLTEQWLDRAATLLPGGFLEDLFHAPISFLYSRLEPEDVSRWTLLNLELWGRLHCWGESSAALLEKIQ